MQRLPAPPTPHHHHGHLFPFPLIQHPTRFGKRMLDAVPAEERLMSGIPKHISRVVIYHPSSVAPADISSDMTTMTKSYGITAVGKAAAATVMLPLALGVDLIILPGPQVGGCVCWGEGGQGGAKDKETWEELGLGQGARHGVGEGCYWPGEGGRSPHMAIC